MLHLWFLGTGGGSGESSMFETWSQEKLDRWDINPQVYDHINVESRPSILIDRYTKHKKYLTMIFLWDEKKDYILASKYNSLKIGEGEVGLSRVESETSALTSITGSGTSRSPNLSKTVRGRVSSKTHEEEAKATMKTVLDLVMEKNSSE